MDKISAPLVTDKIALKAIISFAYSSVVEVICDWILLHILLSYPLISHRQQFVPPKFEGDP